MMPAGLLAAVQELLPQWEQCVTSGQQQTQQEAKQQQQGRQQHDMRDQHAQLLLTPRQPRRPALLVTGGALALDDPLSTKQAVEWGVEGIAIAKAAQHKLVACLRERLNERGVFVGQVTVMGVVRGTAWQSLRSSAEEGEQGDGDGDGDARPVGTGASSGGEDDAAGGFISPEAVADALWELYDSQPAGEGWRVELDVPSACCGVENPG